MSQPAASSLAAQTPPTLNAAAHATDGKKEKKRKIKEDEAAVSATLDVNGDKKVGLLGGFLVVLTDRGTEEEEEGWTSGVGEIHDYTGLDRSRYSIV